MNNKRVIIAGLINVETTVKVHGFPIPYFPIDFTTDGISTGISGVGYNLARAFQKLGDQVFKWYAVFFWIKIIRVSQ